MRLLLDTCTFLWLAAEPSKLSSTAALTLDDVANELFLSDASVWEIALKYKAGKLPLPNVPRQWVPAELLFHGVQSIPVSQCRATITFPIERQLEVPGGATGVRG